MKQSTKELIEVINVYKNGSIGYGLKPYDENSWFRRMFRLYIEGSYSYPANEPGYKFVERLKGKVKDILKSGSETSQQKKIRSLVVDMFMRMLEIEFEVSGSTIQKTIVKHLTKDELEDLNKNLISDLIEFVNE